MSVRRIVRRAEYVPPSLPDVAGALERLLLDWGDWVRSFKDRQGGYAKSAQGFQDVRCGYSDATETLLPAGTETFKTVDSSVNDLGVGTLHWHIVHWHYAQGLNRRGPAVWRNSRLPIFGSPDYVELLDAAKQRVQAGILRRNGSHLLT